MGKLNVRAALVIALKVFALIIIYFLCFVIASALVPLEMGAQQTPADQANAGLALIVVCVANTIVLSYIVLHSRWTRWKSVAALFLLLYGVTTVMPQSESAFFLTKLPPGMLPRLFVFGAIVSAIFSSGAVLILGTRRQGETNSDTPNIGTNQLVWKLAISVVAYVILYFTFGYFIAWKNPAVRAYYGGSDPGGFLTQMRSVIRDTPWLVPFQILRGLLWTALGLTALSMMNGKWWKIALAVGALFAVVMNTQLLLPNPFMPVEVRMTHLIETASSNFIFGCFLGWLFHRRSAVASKSPGLSASA